MVVSCFVFGSYISSPRWLWLIGSNFAEGCSDPARHQSGVCGLRIRAAAHTRACLSIAKLCTVVLLFQITSSPQNGDGAAGGWPAELGVSGSRTTSFTWLGEFVRGSITAR